MEAESPAKPRLIKYKVFGPKNSGRKSLVFRYSQNAFKREEVPTFDIDFMIKMINKNGKKYNLKIFRPKTDDEMGSKDYLKGIKLVIYIFYVTNEESIKHFKDNAEKLFINADNNAFKYVFGNKIDLDDQRKIKEEEAKEICGKYKYEYKEVSCKSGQNIKEVFDENANNYSLIALSYFGNEITYGELFEHIKETAAALTDLGIKRGDVVSFCTVTVPEVIYAFYALNMIGAVGNMIDPRTSIEGIESYIQESKSNCLIILDALVSKLDCLFTREEIKNVIVLSPADSMPTILRLGYKILKRAKISSDKCLLWNKLISSRKNQQIEPRQYEKGVPVSIMHTGGTTGNPKGVLFSDDSYNHLNDQFNHYNMQPQPKDVCLNIMPPFIAYGMAVGIHEFLCRGCKVVIIPLFDPNKIDQLICKYKPQHFWGVPTHLDSLRSSKRIAKTDLSFLKTAGVGGDAIKTDSETVISEFLRTHGCKYGVTKGYGMTEVNSAVSACGDGYNKIGSVGIPLVHTVISAFVPGTQKDLKYGEQGEICIQTPSRMIRYIDREDDNKRVMQKHDDGKIWIHSGDIGYVTEDGFVYIVDRIKRMIIREDGFKVYPSIIENVICECHDVINCAVVGVRNEHFSQGMNPKAYITVRKDCSHEIVISEINNICRKKLSEYQIPNEIEVIDEMPLTKVGKIDYIALEKLATLK